MSGATDIVAWCVSPAVRIRHQSPRPPLTSHRATRTGEPACPSAAGDVPHPPGTHPESASLWHHPSRAVAALVAVLLAGAGTAAGAPPHDDRASGALDRAAVRSLSTVVRVDTYIPIVAVVDGGRRLPIRDEIRITGTGVGVAARRIVTARPVVHPTDAAVMDDLRARHVPGVDALSEDARPVRGDERITVAGAELQASLDSARVTPHPLVVTAEPGDSGGLVVLRTPADGPFLGVSDDQTRGSPMVVVGFGDRSATVPGFRRLTFDVAAKMEGRPDLPLVALTGSVARGDIGAPVIGRDGAVHAIVFARGGTGTPPLAVRSSVILSLVPGASMEEDNPFAAAMELLWSGEYERAAEVLLVAPTRAPSSLVTYEAQRATSLATAAYHVENHAGQWRVALIIAALAASVVSVLILRRLRRDAMTS